MAFLDEQGLQRLADKINVRASSTLPNNAPDGTIIINPDEDTEIFNVDNINIDVDSALSLTSTNPVQNKVVTKELERIPCKLTVKCVSFDGGEITADNAFTTVTYNIGDYSRYEACRNLALTSHPTVKMVYKNCVYRLLLRSTNGTKFGCYYDPIVKGVNFDNPDTLIYSDSYEGTILEKVFTVTQDTEITIMFQKKREPITLTVNLKDKNGNFVSDDIIVTDSFDNKTTTVGTYDSTPGEFTIQVTKGYEYTITPSLKGYNNKENNSPADPDKTTITQTSTEDTVIDIVYNKIYPTDFGTDWASFHAQIAANPGTEILPVGTELSTVLNYGGGTDGSKPSPIKFHIVNWRYAEKSDGSQVWGCDLLSNSVIIPELTYFFDSSSFENGKLYSWKDSYFRKYCNDKNELKTIFQTVFVENLQMVKVTSSITKDTPIYTYDVMWIPSATEMYIDTTTMYPYAFTSVEEGNSNEKYWSNVIGASKFSATGDANEKLQQINEEAPYWLRSGAMMIDHDNINNYIYDNRIWYVDETGALSTERGTNKKASFRPMCFFA